MNDVHFVVEVNFEDTEVRAVQDGETIWNTTMRAGVADWVFEFIFYLRFERQLMIGRTTAEHVFLKLVPEYPSDEEFVIPVKGRSLITGLPELIEVSSTELQEKFERYLDALVGTVNFIFRRAEPESLTFMYPTPLPNALKAHLSDHPILLTGKYRSLKGLDRRLKEATGLPVILEG